MPVAVPVFACGPHNCELHVRPQGRYKLAAERDMRPAGEALDIIIQVCSKLDLRLFIVCMPSASRWHAVLRLALLDCGALYCRMRWEQTRLMMRAARVWDSRWFEPSTRCSVLPSR